LERTGVELLEAPAGADHMVDLRAALGMLAESGVTRVLVEGGAHLAAALLRADLVDRLAWFRSPRLIGGDGLAAAVAFGVDHLAQAPRFARQETQPLGDDLLELYKRI
jgi:diaminohydroxyphosphoribosylaminopyrimidine deaminase/5-amino-6-(5-phosphoribosylamino)uracil reductase